MNCCRWWGQRARAAATPSTGSLDPPLILSCAKAATVGGITMPTVAYGYVGRRGGLSWD